MSAPDWSIIGPACLAGLLVSAIHVPLGLQVLERGIVFIDLAIAQIAGLGVVAGHAAGFESAIAVQACALGAATGGALLLTWTDRRHPQVQEAIIGATFVVAACATLLLLAGDTRGGEHLRDLLVGQILWVTTDQLLAAGAVYATLLAALGARPDLLRRRTPFYLAFAVVVTLSVQLIGVYLVFATLVVPALATRRVVRARLARAMAVSLAGYVLGIGLSAASDTPTGPTIVCAMVAIGLLHAALPRPHPERPS